MQFFGRIWILVPRPPLGMNPHDLHLRRRHRTCDLYLHTTNRETCLRNTIIHTSVSAWLDLRRYPFISLIINPNVYILKLNMIFMWTIYVRSYIVKVNECDGTSQVIRPTYSCPCPTDIRQPCRCPWTTWQVRYLSLPHQERLTHLVDITEHWRWRNAEANYIILHLFQK
jgi:hypothetical protein